MKTKHWVIIGILAVGLFLAGFFVRKQMEKPDVHIDEYQNTQVDSLWNIQIERFDSLAKSNKNLLNNIKNKQNANRQSYNHINSVRFIDDNDSLLQSIIRLTSEEFEFTPVEVEFSEQRLRERIQGN